MSKTNKYVVHKGHFPLGGIFREERHFLLFKDQLAESGRQKTKENIIPRGKFRLVENDSKVNTFFFSLKFEKFYLTLIPGGHFNFICTGGVATGLEN